MDSHRKTPPLKAKVVKAAKWVFVEKTSGRFFDFIKAVVLARLLAPEQFGLFGLVMLAVVILDFFLN